jgi:hypothetical protein
MVEVMRGLRLEGRTLRTGCPVAHPLCPNAPDPQLQGQERGRSGGGWPWWLPPWPLAPNPCAALRVAFGSVGQAVGGTNAPNESDESVPAPANPSQPQPPHPHHPDEPDGPNATDAPNATQARGSVARQPGGHGTTSSGLEAALTNRRTPRRFQPIGTYCDSAASKRRLTLAWLYLISA